MEVSLSIFLFIYLIFIVIFLLMSFFNLYHIVRFGFVSPLAYILTVGYIVLTLLALFVSYYYIAQVDWSATIQIYSATSEILY